MSFDPTKDVCFIGIGASAVAYYRCMLPAMSIGCDWSGIAQQPPEMRYVTGVCQRDSKLVDPFDYKVVVIQQPNHTGWFDLIQELQAKGIKVLYEVDDYLHGIEKVMSHDFRDVFNKALIRRMEAAMRLCDGIICSTPFIAKRYKKFGPTFVCENGIDPARYDLEAAPHDTVNIGWAGATGHKEAIRPWLQQVFHVMRMRETTTFISIGQNYGRAIAKYLEDDARGLAVPWCQIEQYPAAMTMFDIALAPAWKGTFFRGKSDLRWLEAGALGIPIIADPRVYRHIEDGVDGFTAADPMGMAATLTRLIDDPELRTRVGATARERVDRKSVV